MTAETDTLSHAALCLVLFNGYDLLGALQDNWAVFWYGLGNRAVGVASFWYLGEPWSKLVGLESASFATLGVAMWFA